MIGSLMMCVSVVVLLVGMLAGIAMGIRQDFTLAAGACASQPGRRRAAVPVRIVLPAGSWPRGSTQRSRKVQGWLHIVGGDPISGRASRIVAVEGHRRSIVLPIVGLADRGRGDGAVRGDRVPDLAGLNDPTSLGRPARHRGRRRRHFLSPSMA